MKPVRFFLIWADIILLILATYHVIMVVQPIIALTSGGLGDTSNDPTDLLLNGYSVPEDPDAMTAHEFAQMVLYYQAYDWENYNQDDFPGWLYMPATVDDNESASPWGSYPWGAYDPSDFPSWLDMPASLPPGFNSTEFDPIDYMDPEFQAEVETEIAAYTEMDPSQAILYYLFGTTSDPTSDPMGFLSSLVSGSDLIRAILFFMSAIIVFVVLRTAKEM